MGFFSSKGPDERRAEGAQHRQHDRDAKALKAGDPKATRINDKLNDRRLDAKRDGR
jgi:hypothetical protein